ncbi:DNA adenine methylase [Williamsoniiplasma lucivorax]|uniref:Site-specific DNA-methyltransferase (adenine-specific) n=1 Tax=Williamsoniiplasma lucivorax TaxID=209274 RepID=A0A2S5RF44_9MOLU|nr:Dam family site-specific DNA-(adenine-N6)-methyltransferase [Williamsoniiplasma lucivorax]PPE05934.1 restriction endonuclease subunit M [Williamsoniiplasma lucivorax]
MNKINPFIKWVGGKRQLLSEINVRKPEHFNNYFEPFVGGGAVFLALQNKNKTYINDISTELTDAYKTIKDDHLNLMKLLDKHQEAHKNNPKEYFYEMRSWDRDENWNQISQLEKTARLIYLNKTCFNGLYRVNKSGFFNTPWNGKLEINLYDRENIINLHNFLNKKVVINNGDFAEICKHAKKGDFIFFDPPYDLINATTFDSYTKNPFGVEGQKRLAELAHQLSERGCYVMLTNHNTPLINELYKDFKIDVVNVKRMINSKSDQRFGVETIIYNY